MSSFLTRRGIGSASFQTAIGATDGIVDVVSGALAAVPS